MSAHALTNAFRSRSAFDLSPVIRGLVLVSGVTMTTLCAIALARFALGLSPDLPHLTNIAIAFHVATVIPCVPLGLYLLVAPKGTAMHKQLGKLWLALMVITATSTLFIHGGFSFSWIHIFVPVTYRAAWKIIATARAGNIKAHRNEIVSLYLGALMIPGIFAFVVDNRLMNVMLLGW